MKQVFISYSTQETENAKKVVEALEKQGIECWIAPRDIQAGADYARDISDAIEEAPYFMPLISDAYDSSVYTMNELSHALRQKKNIIPLQIGDEAPSKTLESLLADNQIRNYKHAPKATLDNVAEQIKRSEPHVPQLQDGDHPEELVVYHVFVSHSTADDKTAEKIVDHLEKRNIKCWIAPRDTRSHATFPAQITQAVRECPVFLLLVSRRSMESSHVEREISLAIDKKISPGYKYIIPLMLDNAELTDEFCYYLANLHYYAFHENEAGVLDKITEQIQQFVRQEEASQGKYLSQARELYRASRYREAVQYYLKAARLGNVDAQAMLGYCYHTGVTGTRNIEEAIKWYTQAANQGHANAQSNLALCYAYESSVGRDWDKAIAFFRKAADQGHAGAQRHLGYCYAQGNGVEKNLAEARKWYQKAADQGDEDARNKLKNLQ